jgi:hypothetical protein
MGKTYCPYILDQMFLLPPSLRDWLPENHWACFVSDMVENPDLSQIELFYEKLSRRETQLQRIREAKGALGQNAAKAYSLDT